MYLDKNGVFSQFIALAPENGLYTSTRNLFLRVIRLEVQIHRASRFGDWESLFPYFFIPQKEHTPEISCSHWEEGIEGEGPTSSNFSIKVLSHFLKTQIIIIVSLVSDYM